MHRILLKRAFRDVRGNLFRYLALLLLIAASLYLVVGTVAAAESTIASVDEAARANNLEDGQFGTFAPLTADELAGLAELGIQVEPAFYLDYAQPDGSTLRLMKNRENVNKVEVEQGRAVRAGDEAVVERLYAQAHGLEVGDTIGLGDLDLTVCGIGSTPDYDHCLRSTGDMSADGRVFGTLFVPADTYEKVKSHAEPLQSEEYRYSYVLGAYADDDAVKDYLGGLSMPLDDVEDQYFREEAQRLMADRDDFEEGVATLVDGSTALDEAAGSLDEGARAVDNGVGEAYAALGQLQSSSGPLTEGSAAIMEALRTIESAATSIGATSGAAGELQQASARLVEGARQLDGALQGTSGQVGSAALDGAVSSALVSEGLDPAALSPDAQVVWGASRAYVGQVQTSMSQLAAASSDLRTGAEAFDAAVGELPGQLKQLDEGIAGLGAALGALSDKYAALDGGVGAYAGGVDRLTNAYGSLVEGSAALSAGASDLAEGSAAYREGVGAFQEETGAWLDESFSGEVDKLTDFITAADNPRIKAASDDVLININVGLFAGLVVLVLFSYVISVFVVHTIDTESAVIGALYALGVKRRELIGSYVLLPVLICLVGGMIGTAIGYSDIGIENMMDESRAYYSTPPIHTFYNPGLLAYGIVVPPVVAAIVTYATIRRKLDRPVLSLLRKEQREGKVSRLNLDRFGFVSAFTIRQLLRERRSNLAVIAGMFVSLLVLVMGVNCYALCVNLKADSLADMRYEYSYLLKYPPQDVPAGGAAAYVESLSSDALDYEMDIAVVGLSEDNPYFPRIESARSDEMSISSSVAMKYGLKAGDTIVLKDGVSERGYAFDVREVVPYGAGLTCFMDVDAMRDLFDREDDYYNAVYSDHELDIDSGRLYSVSTRADAAKTSDIFMGIMFSMIVTLVSMSILVFLIVLYQMTKVAVDRAALSMSIMKVFGYREREIRRLYLDGSFIVVAVGALASIPLAKALMDAAYPSFVENVQCGIRLTWPPELYIATYLGVMASYLLIRALLVRRVRKTAPADALKDRE